MRAVVVVTLAVTLAVVATVVMALLLNLVADNGPIPDAAIVPITPAPTVIPTPWPSPLCSVGDCTFWTPR